MNRLRDYADKMGYPLGTLDKTKATLAECKKQNSDEGMARLMLRFGRIDDEARDYLVKTYPQLAGLKAENPTI